MVIAEIVSHDGEAAGFRWLLCSNAVFAERRKGVRDGDGMDQCD